ncbi:hypothetical protein, partial [Candidatus Albibeggiatoa sp. nov. BB20]|uniref:InlB B-repeat-containing protein n=1 Tax=Candidatus Albibeggiatoa sp. nov. BB20 TaxID=3162723 RepID=UPI0033659DFC
DSNAALGYHYGYGDYGLVYPDANGYIQPWDSVVEGYSENTSITVGTTGWTWYEGQLFTAPNTNTWGATPILISDSNSGTVLLDDFVVDEYDAAGNFVRRIHDIDPDPKPSDWWMLYETHAARAPFVSYTNDWSGLALDSGSSGSKSTSTTAHVGDKSLSLNSTSGKYAISNQKLNFSIKQSHQYRISGWVQGTNVAGSGANLGLRWLGFKSWDTPRPFTKASLETGFFDNDGLQFYINANVPVNIGEFGTAVANFQDGRGGLAWVSDMLDIMDTYDLNGQYFHYHSAPWGIYSNVFGFPNATHLNTDLANLFVSRNYRSGLNPATYSLDVVNGNGDGNYAETAQITITADAAPTGQVFDVWTGDTAALADSTQSMTTVTMPATAITVTATYRTASPILYTLSVNNGNGDGDYTEGSQVTVTADTAPTAQVFDTWTGDTGVLADPTQATTTVTMPAAAATITATYKADTPTLYTLTVNSGSGDGDYTA